MFFIKSRCKSTIFLWNYKMKIYFYAKYNNDANKFYTNLYLVNNENGRCGIEMRKRYKDDDDNYINLDYKI